MCNCIDEINKKLQDAGHNTRIGVTLNFMTGITYAAIHTVKADPNSRKKPIAARSGHMKPNSKEGKHHESQKLDPHCPGRGGQGMLHGRHRQREEAALSSGRGPGGLPDL